MLDVDVEKERIYERNMYRIQAHLAPYLTYLRYAASTNARPSIKSTIAVCVMGDDPVRTTHTLSPPFHE